MSARQRLVGFMTIGLFTAAACISAAQAPEPRTAKRVIAETRATRWHLVVLGDSILADFPARYADILKHQLGIDIDVSSYTVETSQEMLGLLRQSGALRQDLVTADVIFFHVPRRWAGTYYDEAGVTPATSSVPQLEDRLKRALEAYKADVTAIVAEILRLRSPFDALIRTMDVYADWNLDDARREGVQPLLQLYWSAANDYLSAVATQSRVPVARVYEVFNGVSGNEDPLAKGYLRPDAPRLCTELGLGQIIRAVDELGLGYGLYFPT